MKGRHTYSMNWAPVLMEPILGSGERIAIAIVGRLADGTARVLPLLNDTFLSRVARAEAGEVREVVHMVMESLAVHIDHSASLSDWSPPLEGVFLGEVREAYSDDLEETLSRASSFVSFFHSPFEQQKGTIANISRAAWNREVISILLGQRQELRRNLDVEVRLGKMDVHPVRFTFFNQEYAALTFPFNASGLKQKVEAARAILWELLLLEDSPSYIFKPKHRELIAGSLLEKSDQGADLVAEAIEEIESEADRRGVQVVRVDSSLQAADRILAQIA